MIAVALSEDMLGREQSNSLTIGTGSWCWVKCLNDDPKKTMIYMLVTGKLFEMLCYLLTVTFYILLKFKLVNCVFVYYDHKEKTFALSVIKCIIMYFFSSSIAELFRLGQIISRYQMNSHIFWNR